MTDGVALLSGTPGAEDAEARMTAILHAHMPALRRFARMLASQPDLAEDLVQQTCLKAWIARLAYDHSRPAGPWLFQIMKNEFRQTLRRPQPVTNVPETVFDGRTPDAEANNDVFEVLSLWRHLSMLPEDQRRAIVLVMAFGLTYEEAGLESQCLPGTVKSRVNRGKHRLRNAMGLQSRAITTAG